MHTMSCFRVRQVALAAIFASAVGAQQSGWQPNQVNATMCAWKGLRAATIKDSVFMDGGYLYWQPGMEDGSYAAPTQDDNPLGIIYTWNFSRPFNLSSNISEILGTQSKVQSGNAANNLAPNYFDGAMLANDHEFFLYGGLLRRTDQYTPPDGNEVLSYQISQYGVPKGAFKPGFVRGELPEGLTRYITYGGAASAPSENKAWYFGGMRSPTFGPIFYPSSNASINPSNTSHTLITLDMAVQQNEKWSNNTLPDEIKGRADPELVWVPVGEQGILVVLGGVSYPDFSDPNLNSQNEAQSEKESPTFMSTIDIYDIARDKWYQQPTVAGPMQLTQGCAVVAVAQDYSSYNIYYYGGYDGINANGDYNDDVWILSLPSFMWMKVASGKPQHARAGHKCVKPYPDQMVVVGGAKPSRGNNFDCVEDNVMLNFNLTDGQWLDSYDPDVWSNYGVPQMIHVMIGGDYEGGATMTTPTPTGWADPELASVFATPYETSKLTNYYPYEPQDTNGNPREKSDGGGGGLAPWVAPVLGVVLGLVFISAVIVGILIYRRRRLLRRGGGAGGSQFDENGNRITSWIRGIGTDKTGTVTSEDTAAAQHDDVESRLQNKGPPLRQPDMAMVRQFPMSEMSAETPPVELMDTSPRAAELGDTALTPVEIINKHTHFGTSSNPHTPRTPTNPSSSFFTGSGGATASVSQPDHVSVASSSHHGGGYGGPTGLHAPPSPHQQQQQVYGGGGSLPRDSIDQHRPDSPALGQQQQQQQSTGMPAMPTPIRTNTGGFSIVSPGGSVGGGGPGTPLISPPSPSLGRDAPDYISVHSSSQGAGNRSLTTAGSGGGGGSSSGNSNNNRRSMFRENPDDLGEMR